MLEDWKIHDMNLMASGWEEIWGKSKAVGWSGTVGEASSYEKSGIISVGGAT